MVAGSKAVKSTAKAALKGNYLNVVFTLLILIFSFFFCELLLSLISVLKNNVILVFFRIYLSALIISPLILGAVRYVWRLLFGIVDKPISLFYYYSEKRLFLKAAKFIVLFSIKIVFFAFLLFLPALFITTVSNQEIYSFLGMKIPIWIGNLNNIAYIFYGIATVALPFVCLKYYISPILFVADENIDPAEAIHMSTVISRGTLTDFLLLILTLFGWLLLSALVFPLPFVLPYLLTVYAVHARYAIADYNKQIKTPKTEEFLFYSV